MMIDEKELLKVLNGVMDSTGTPSFSDYDISLSDVIQDYKQALRTLASKIRNTFMVKLHYTYFDKTHPMNPEYPKAFVYVDPDRELTFNVLEKETLVARFTKSVKETHCSIWVGYKVLESQEADYCKNGNLVASHLTCIGTCAKEELEKTLEECNSLIKDHNSKLEGK
jgi:hypothetical protein